MVCMERAAFAGLVLTAFTLPFSLPAARVFTALGALLLAADALRRRRRIEWPAVAGWAALFVIVAVGATFHGARPDLGLPKLRKFFWLAILPLAAALTTTPGRLRAVLAALAAGAGVLALRACVAQPLLALRGAAEGRLADFGTGLIMVGSMTDAQRLMVGALATLALWTASRREGRRALGWGALLGLQAAALVLHFKRGSWFCALGVGGVYVAAKARGRRVLWVGLAAAALLLLLPPVRARLAGLREELTRPGGRLTMWTRVTPELARRHPWFGIGYRSLTNRMMRSIDPRVERGRDHLHSNLAQVLVETGLAGLAVYALWMAQALADAVRFRRAAQAGMAEALAGAEALLLALIALLANGLVEYNFGDSEILMLYGLAMGCAAAGARWARAPAA